MAYFELSWHEALFSFRFENNIPAVGKVKTVKENVMMRTAKIAPDLRLILNAFTFIYLIFPHFNRHWHFLRIMHELKIDDWSHNQESDSFLWRLHYLKAVLLPQLLRPRTQNSNRPRQGRSPIPGGYYHTLPMRVCAAQRGRDFEAPDLERGIHFRGVV